MKIGDVVLIAIPTAMVIGFALTSKKIRNVVSICAIVITVLSAAVGTLHVLATLVAPYSSLSPEHLIDVFLGILGLLIVLLAIKYPTREKSDSTD